MRSKHNLGGVAGVAGYACPPRADGGGLEPQDGGVVVPEGVGGVEPAAKRFEGASDEETPEVPEPRHRGDERPGIALARKSPQRTEVVGTEHGRHEDLGLPPRHALGVHHNSTTC